MTTSSKPVITLRIDESYTGVTLVEMESLLDLGDEALEVRWENTKPEMRLLLRRLGGRKITLVVPNLAAAERAATALGLHLNAKGDHLVSALAAINRPEGQWREFTTRMGPQLSRGLAIQAMANILRSGGRADALQKALVDSVLGGTSPVDLDALYGLRTKGARV